MRPEHQVVRLRNAIGSIPKGTAGTVMTSHPDGKEEYLVEFDDPAGREILLISVAESDLEEGEAILTEDDLQLTRKIWDASKYTD